jgi:hypothetical protein
VTPSALAVLAMDKCQSYALREPHHPPRDSGWVCVACLEETLRKNQPREVYSTESVEALKDELAETRLELQLVRARVA